MHCHMWTVLMWNLFVSIPAGYTNVWPWNNCYFCNVHGNLGYVFSSNQSNLPLNCLYKNVIRMFNSKVTAMEIIKHLYYNIVRSIASISKLSDSYWRNGFTGKVQPCPNLTKNIQCTYGKWPGMKPQADLSTPYVRKLKTIVSFIKVI